MEKLLIFASSTSLKKGAEKDEEKKKEKENPKN